MLKRNTYHISNKILKKNAIVNFLNKNIFVQRKFYFRK